MKKDKRDQNGFSRRDFIKTVAGATAGVFVGRSAYIRDPDGNVIEFIDLKRAPGAPA